jgi:hypothetical protein
MSRHGTCANVIGRRALLATLRFAPDNALELTCEPRQMLKPTIPVRPFPASRDLNNLLDRFSELLCGAS